ncbi:MAG: molybdopterin-dependent oxidoreductase [Chloroflexi bacterium]|nr:molybdopterin-dependent oxidoreductase [Chloroflexota bacterium]
MTLVGESVKRIEDPRLITGKGTYVADVTLPGMLYMTVVRSPHGHANIKNIDVSAATSYPGVVAAFTGADIAEQLGSLPVGWVLDEDMKQPPHPPLAVDKVRIVGDAVAVVVAETNAASVEAAELVDVDYEVLPAVTDAVKAQASDAPQLHEEAPGNLAFTWEIEGGSWDEAVKNADVVVKEKIVNQRLIPNAIETRGVVADYNPGTDQITMWTSTQIPHLIRLLFTLVTGHPESKVRIIAPEVGGAFGSKLFLYAEEVIAGIVAKQIGKPVKWIETRQENYLATAHGRDHIAFAEMAGNKDGEILGINVVVNANMGAYLSTFAPLVPTILFGIMLAGVYKMPNVKCKVLGVFTNTTPTDAYRGAGRPEATFLLERMVDRFAQEIGRDPVVVRRKNMINAFRNGYEVPTGVMYDTGNFKGALNKALENFDYQGFRKEQREARRNGKLLGVGWSTYIEITGMAPSAVAASLGAGAGLWESSTVRVHPTGSVSVYAGTAPSGQGHETSFAQMVSSELGVPMENIEVHHGDTDKQQFGTGTFGSRSLAVGGAALHMSLAKVVAKAKTIAAHQMGVPEKQVEYSNGTFIVEDIPERSLAFGDVALEAYLAKDLPPGMEPGLEATSFFDPDNFTWPFGAHVAIVEIDPDTGDVQLKRYLAVDDVGNVMNPMIVDGMIHGGVVQGIGQALWENAVYDDDGQLLSGSMLDYALPNAKNLPFFETDRTVTPTKVNPLGAKGAGEAGTIAACPAIVNACVDALKHLGVTHIDMPVTSEKVWRILDEKGKAHPRRK